MDISLLSVLYFIYLIDKTKILKNEKQTLGHSAALVFGRKPRDRGGSILKKGLSRLKFKMERCSWNHYDAPQGHVRVTQIHNEVDLKCDVERLQKRLYGCVVVEGKKKEKKAFT